MSMIIQSTTDTPEAVTAALGEQAKPAPEKPEPQEEVQAQASQSEEEASEPVTDEPAESEEEIEDDEQDAESDAQSKPKKLNGFQRKVNKFNERLQTEAREKEYWREQALRAQKPSEPQASDKTSQGDKISQQASAKPKAEDFERHEDYVEAVTDWKVQHALKEQEIKQKEAAAKSEEQAKLQKHFERVNEFAKGKEDWSDVIETIGKAPLTITTQQAIIDSDYGPQIMYELAKDPAELKRICSLAPVKAAMALGKIEARVSQSAPPAPQEKKTTKAPPPVNPVKARSTTATGKSIYDENLSLRDYEKARAEQVAQRAKSSWR